MANKRTSSFVSQRVCSSPSNTLLHSTIPAPTNAVNVVETNFAMREHTTPVHAVDNECFAAGQVSQGSDHFSIAKGVNMLQPSFSNSDEGAFNNSAKQCLGSKWVNSLTTKQVLTPSYAPIHSEDNRLLSNTIFNHDIMYTGDQPNNQPTLEAQRVTTSKTDTLLHSPIPAQTNAVNVVETNYAMRGHTIPVHAVDNECISAGQVYQNSDQFSISKGVNMLQPSIRNSDEGAFNNSDKQCLGSKWVKSLTTKQVLSPSYASIPSKANRPMSNTLFHHDIMYTGDQRNYQTNLEAQRVTISKEDSLAGQTHMTISKKDTLAGQNLGSKRDLSFTTQQVLNPSFNNSLSKQSGLNTNITPISTEHDVIMEVQRHIPPYCAIQAINSESTTSDAPAVLPYSVAPCGHQVFKRALTTSQTDTTVCSRDSMTTSEQHLSARHSSPSTKRRRKLKSIDVVYDKVERPVSTAIYSLLTSGSVAKLHLIPCAETFHFYKGEPITVFEIHDDGRIKLTDVGSDLGAGQRPQYTVPPNVWFGFFPKLDVESCEPDGSSLVKAPNRDPEEHFSLVGITCAPAFQFEDCELGRHAELSSLAPTAKPFIDYLLSTNSSHLD